MEMENEVVLRTAKICLGEDGIVRATYFPNTEETLAAEIKEQLAAIVKISKGEKRPYFADIRNIKSTDRESRKYAASEEVANAISAMALLIGSPVSKVIGNFFLVLNKPKFPVKLFTSEVEATEWLKGFIE